MYKVNETKNALKGAELEEEYNEYLSYDQMRAMRMTIGNPFHMPETFEEKQTAHERISALMTYFVLDDASKAEDRVAKILYLMKFAKKIGPALNEEIGYDLRHSQNTDDSLYRVCNSLLAGKAGVVAEMKEVD